MTHDSKVTQTSGRVNHVLGTLAHFSRDKLWIVARWGALGSATSIVTKRFTLMCRDHEALVFVRNVPERSVVGRVRVLGAANIPWGALRASGGTDRSALAT